MNLRFTIYDLRFLKNTEQNPWAARFAARLTKYTLAVALTACLGAPCRGQLTATVHPGYQFSADERPTTDTLNQLGQPTITIAGTVSGTVGLSTNSVSGDHLMDSVVDNRTINFSNTSPRELQVKLGGINTNELNAGLYLVLTNTATTASNALYMATNLFVSANLALSNGLTTVNIAHGLGQVPTRLRVVLVKTNTVSDHTYDIGDEVEVAGLTGSGSSAAWGLYGANATNVFLASQTTTPALNPKLAGGAQTGVTGYTNWALKIYAWR